MDLICNLQGLKSIPQHTIEDSQGAASVSNAVRDLVLKEIKSE